MYDIFISFFKDNQHLFRKHRNINTGQDHADNITELKLVYNVQFPFGYCFPISQFMFYYLGGYGSDYELRCIRGIPISIKGCEHMTTHWFVINKLTAEIIDLSKEQFEKILDIDKYYHKGRKANFGFPYLKKGGKRYKNTAPSKTVLKLYEQFRKIYLNSQSETLEFYLKEYKSL